MNEKLLKDLAQGILDGHGSWDVLSDALIEMGLDNWAECHCFDSFCRNNPRNCSLIDNLTRDGGIEFMLESSENHIYYK